jgi:Flp pilus assembly pilin Flp
MEGTLRYLRKKRYLFESKLGQSTVEYGLILATVALLVLMGLPLFGGTLRQWFELLASRITTNT